MAFFKIEMKNNISKNVFEFDNTWWKIILGDLEMLPVIIDVLYM